MTTCNNNFINFKGNIKKSILRKTKCCEKKINKFQALLEDVKRLKVNQFQKFNV